MPTLNYPDPTISLELEKRLQQTRHQHEINYGMLFVAALLALAIFACVWFNAHSDRTILQPTNPRSDLSSRAPSWQIVTNQNPVPGQENYCHGDMPVLPILTATP